MDIEKSQIFRQQEKKAYRNIFIVPVKVETDNTSNRTSATAAYDY